MFMNDSLMGHNETGGGFMNEPNDLSSPSQKGKGGVQRLQSVVPVCIRQLRDCQEDEFSLFGMQTQILTLVGILREYEVQSTKATYKIEDHTGTISAIWWLESDSSSTPNLPLVKEGCYLRCHGSLRVQEGQKILMVLKMCPVDNINEVTQHLLEVIHTRLEAEKLLCDSSNMSRMIKTNNPGADLANSMSFMDTDQPMSNSTFTALQDKVYNILKACKNDNGVATNTILAQFSANQHRDAKDALEFLISEGHAYSTVDNDHFKITESI